MMNFSLQKVQLYCESLSSSPGSLLYELERETFLKTLAPQMISGHLQGRILAFISQMLNPEHILEIGTFTGYGTLCLAEGLAENGRITTLESNPELEPLFKHYFDKSVYRDKIKYCIVNAKDWLNENEIEKFDLIFVDASKRDYTEYFNLCIDKLKINGIMIFDNVLWSGKVVMKNKDPDTQIIHDFNYMIKKDMRVSQILLPIRDGLMILAKRS